MSSILNVYIRGLHLAEQTRFNAQEGRKIFLRGAFPFIQNAKARLPAVASAKLIIHNTKSESTNSTHHRFISYYLYPVDIRLHTLDEPETLIIFDTDDPISFVPDNYSIIYQHDTRSLLATRKKP